MKKCKKMVFAGLAVLLLMTVLSIPVLAEAGTADGGDLLLFDSEAKVTDSVDGDLLAFVMELTVEGKVQGSIRACANEMLLNGAVSRNVTVAGTVVECGEQFAANDVKIVGEQVVFLGACDTLSIYGGTVYIGGTVRGTVYCEAGQVVLLEDADISAAEITSSSEPRVAKSTSDTSYKSLEGSAFQDVVKFKKTESALVSELKALPFTLIAAVILAVAVAFVFSRMSDRIPRQCKEHPFLFCLKGFAAMIAIPFGAILLLIPAVTWPISISLLLIYIVLLLLADAIAAVVLSRVLLTRWNPYLSAAFAAAVLTVLSVIPYVGFFVSLLCVTVGFGAVVSLVSKQRDPIVNVNPEMDFRV